MLKIDHGTVSRTCFILILTHVKVTSSVELSHNSFDDSLRFDLLMCAIMNHFVISIAKEFPLSREEYARYIRNTLQMIGRYRV